jgi:hypothetical protein
MWQRPFVLEHLAEIAAIDPAAARRAPDVMLGLVLGWLADRPPEIGASWDIAVKAARMAVIRSWIMPRS